jgi:hypothetical protein
MGDRKRPVAPSLNDGARTTACGRPDESAERILWSTGYVAAGGGGASWPSGSGSHAVDAVVVRQHFG